MIDPNEFTQEKCEEILDRLGKGEEDWACGTHGYIPGRNRKPAKGCKDCWLVLYYTLYARTPKEERGDFKEGMQMTLRHMEEHLKLGVMEFLTPERPTIEIIKE